MVLWVSIPTLEGQTGCLEMDDTTLEMMLVLATELEEEQAEKEQEQADGVDACDL